MESAGIRVMVTWSVLFRVVVRISAGAIASTGTLLLVSNCSLLGLVTLRRRLREY